ncbi:hypothetical protein [Kitasatospora sp. NPDC057936]|uniref:hypothetical protein n=1 Tax=Kitasatospora sp. NPDC057936 TaxID=3346283 RepID=UPI0036DD788D
MADQHAAAGTADLAARSQRTWDEPFFTAVHRPVGTATTDDVWADTAVAYARARQERERTRESSRT